MGSWNHKSLDKRDTGGSELEKEMGQQKQRAE